MLVFPPLVLPHTHVHSSLPVWKFSGLTFQSERSGLCRRGLVLVVQSRLARTQSQLRHVLQIWSRLTFPRHLNRKILLRSDSILALLLRLPREMPFVPKPQSGGETPRLIFDISKIFFLAFFSCYAPSCRLTHVNTPWLFKWITFENDISHRSSLHSWTDFYFLGPKLMWFQPCC